MCVDMFRDGSELGVGRVRELCYERLREQAKIKGNESVNGKGFQRWFFKICPWTLAFNDGHPLDASIESKHLKRDADEKAKLLLHAEERRNDALLKSESCKGDKVTLLARIGELDDKLRLKTQEIEEAEMKREMRQKLESNKMVMDNMSIRFRLAKEEASKQ
ncbi:hypothetical protein JHK87_048062 [Glycine soja]|nr:hypothetical protein JHK87_048062 [Glycine soja]